MVAQYLLASAKIDVVLKVIQMLVMDGYEAIKKLRAEAGEAGRQVPIIVMTAYAMSTDRDRALALNVEEHPQQLSDVNIAGILSKPVDRSTLLEYIEESLS